MLNSVKCPKELHDQSIIPGFICRHQNQNRPWISLRMDLVLGLPLDIRKMIAMDFSTLSKENGRYKSCVSSLEKFTRCMGSFLLYPIVVLGHQCPNACGPLDDNPIKLQPLNCENQKSSYENPAVLCKTRRFLFFFLPKFSAFLLLQ